MLCERNMYDVCYNDFEIDSNQDLLYTKVTPQICVKNKNVIKLEKHPYTLINKNVEEVF